ncbi:hypothetical protein TKK_0013075 [Trichogramma kaykai]
MIRYKTTVHKGRKDFKCDKCEKKFVEKSKLIKHQMKVHDDPKYYQCDKCEKKFGRKSSLISHLKKHEDVSEDLKDYASHKGEQQFDDPRYLINSQKTLHESRVHLGIKRILLDTKKLSVEATKIMHATSASRHLGLKAV